MKSKILKITVYTVAISLLMTIPYLLVRSYWGKNHEVLYNVTKISAEDFTEENGYYEYHIFGTVKNWPDDFEEKVYYLSGISPRGSVDYSGIEIRSNLLTVTQKKSDMEIVIKIYPDKVNPETLTIKSRDDVDAFIKDLWIDSKDINGEWTDPLYTLYMADYNKIEVVPKLTDHKAE